MSLVDWNGYRLLVLEGPWRRLVGARLRPPGIRGLLIKDCSAIHTHWGWPLSQVFFVDVDLHILRSISPARFRFYFCRKARHAIELF
jgi:hypothetical protein